MVTEKSIVFEGRELQLYYGIEPLVWAKFRIIRKITKRPKVSQWFSREKW